MSAGKFSLSYRIFLALLSVKCIAYSLHRLSFNSANA